MANHHSKTKLAISVPLFCAALFLIGCSNDHSGEIKYYVNEQYKEAGFPFSDAVEVDGLIFLSGAIGLRPGTTELVEGGIDAESRQVMDNIKASLETIGLGMDDVIKCTVMIDEMSDWPAFNEIYKTYFDGNYPARSALGADGLALGALIEVECIARR